ncbi:hypothetical protein AAHC03_018976 [Spirometra sp. Aus1]
MRADLQFPGRENFELQFKGWFTNRSDHVTIVSFSFIADFKNSPITLTFAGPISPFGDKGSCSFIYGIVTENTYRHGSSLVSVPPASSPLYEPFHQLLDLTRGRRPFYWIVNRSCHLKEMNTECKRCYL